MTGKDSTAVAAEVAAREAEMDRAAFAAEQSALAESGQYRIVNRTGLPDGDVQVLVRQDPEIARVLDQVGQWRRLNKTRTAEQTSAYVPYDHYWDELRAARLALETDDIVSGVADITEAYAFTGSKWESADPDDADIFNQVSRLIDMDSLVRKIWREMATGSQSVVGTSWERRVLRTRGKTAAGNRKRKTYEVTVPVVARVLNAAEFVPIAHSPMQRRERLAWMGSEESLTRYRSVLADLVEDPFMSELLGAQYRPSGQELLDLMDLGVPTDRLVEVDSTKVWRHTATKPDYRRMPDIRLKSCFALLDLKRQLIAADRAALIGNANMIILVRKGDDKRPATAAEMEGLNEGWDYMAKSSTVISDHRLQVDLIAPKTDHTLSKEKLDLLDDRLTARLLGTLATIGTRGGENTGGGEAVARGMENQRLLIKRTLEARLAREIVEHPDNAGVFDGEPNLVFTPARIQIEIDGNFMRVLESLRSTGDVSRETILEAIGLDQPAEAQRRTIEDELYDDIFQTRLPYDYDPSGQPPETPQESGRRGGRPVGGGDSPRSPQGQRKPLTANGNPSTGAGA